MRTELKKFRVGLHLTQAEMAEKCKVSRVTYGHIENGSRSGSADFWETLKTTFDVPDSEMYILMKREERAKQ